MENKFLSGSICAVASVSAAMTFFHPVFWLGVGFSVGLALLLLTPALFSPSHAERPAVFLLLFWTALTVAFSILYGATEEFYNLRQIGLLLIGLTVGYFISVVQFNTYLAWAPFGLFAGYFGALALLGQSADNAFPDNSRNYVSLVLLALYASAMLMSRPSTIRFTHLSAAILVLILSIWSVGRAGIICAFLLCAALFVGLLLQRRSGVVRAFMAVLVIMALAAISILSTQLLQSQGQLERLAERGLSDVSRIAIIINYFYQIDALQLLFGKNYYSDSFMTKWNFNLHNTYLSVWAHLGLSYLLLILSMLWMTIKHLRSRAAIAIAVLIVSLRGVTDTHIYCGQFDYIAFAALFIFLRSPDDLAHNM
jgi:hypothetical protein